MPSKKGLARPAAPIDIFTLQPDPELAGDTTDAEAPAAAAPAPRPAPARPARQAPRAKKVGQTKAKKKAQEPASPASETRIKTSIELSEETLELIQQIKLQHRRAYGKHYPLWQIVEDAIRQLAEREEKGKR